MSEFQPALNYVLKNEGGLIENENDKGGITNCGISLRFLKNMNKVKLRVYEIFDDPNENTIRNLTKAQIERIYYNEFYMHAPFNQIENQQVCNYIFDMAVNMGIAPSIKCVQRSIWAIMGNWQELKDDGIFGIATLELINKIGASIMDALRAERGSYYRQLAEQMPNQKEFLRGWYDRTYRSL